MSRKLRAHARRPRAQARRCRAAYPRDLPALRRTADHVDYDFAGSNIVSISTVRRGLIVTGGRRRCGVEAPRRLVEGARRSSRQVFPAYALLIFDVGFTRHLGGRREITRNALAAPEVSEDFARGVVPRAPVTPPPGCRAGTAEIESAHGER